MEEYVKGCTHSEVFVLLGLFLFFHYTLFFNLIPMSFFISSLLFCFFPHTTFYCKSCFVKSISNLIMSIPMLLFLLCFSVP